MKYCVGHNGEAYIVWETSFWFAGHKKWQWYDKLAREIAREISSEHEGCSRVPSSHKDSTLFNLGLLKNPNHN